MNTFENEKFQKANERSLKIAEQIEKVLRFKGLPSLIPVINSCSISLKLPSQFRQRNSTLCVDHMGHAKSTLLIHILAKSNPKFFQPLPKKMFESQLLKNEKDYFDFKILVHDDLITAFGGLSTKQRQQLVSFFTQLLSDGCYDRQDFNNLKNITTLCHFGIALEMYQQYNKHLLDSTFLDRFASYQVPLTLQQKEEVLERMDMLKEENIPLPVIKLPLYRGTKVVELKLTPEMKEQRNKLVLELDLYHILSFTRAQNYIDQFMMCNALLNGRTETCIWDLELYKLLHPYHKNASISLKNEQKVLEILRKDPKISGTKIAQITGISKSTVYRTVERLKNRGEI